MVLMSGFLFVFWVFFGKTYFVQKVFRKWVVFYHERVHEEVSFEVCGPKGTQNGSKTKLFKSISA